MQYALSKGVDIIAAAGNESHNLDDPKFDNVSPNNGTVIRNRPVDLVRHDSVLCQYYFKFKTKLLEEPELEQPQTVS